MNSHAISNTRKMHLFNLKLKIIKIVHSSEEIKENSFYNSLNDADE